MNKITIMGIGYFNENESWNIKKIAVLRANALGDYIFSIPALDALKKRYPGSELVLLGNAWHKAFLKGRPGPVDRVVVVPTWNGIPDERDCVEDEREVDIFFTRMRIENFDIAFQMHGGGRHSNPFVKNLGARLSIGLQDDNAPPLDINIPYQRHQSEVLRHLEVVRKAGATQENIEPSIRLIESDFDELNGYGANTPYAVIHPGASDRCRQWPAEKFAKVADFLIESGLHVYLTGIDNERRVIDGIRYAMKYRAEDVCGKLSLKGLAALLSGAGILVANDTGPLHLARAVGTPTVGIFWIINLITSNSIAAEKNRNCIAWNICCPLCGADCLVYDMKPVGSCAHDISFVDTVAIEEVIHHSRSLLAGSPSKSSYGYDLTGS